MNTDSTFFATLDFRSRAATPVTASLRRQWRLVTCLYLVSCLSLSTRLTAQEFGNGVLLLKETDRVLAGKLTVQGEFYEVEIAPESRVSIPVKNVSLVAASMEELYQAKRRSISSWNAGEHFQLTRWCLLNNLLEHAVEHYAETAQRNPDHPRVRQLGLELQDRLLRDEKFRQYLGLQAAGNSVEGRSAQPVSTASASAPADTQYALELSSGTTSPSSVVSAGGPEAQTSQSPEIARLFSERVQPILVNRCSQAACHGSQSTNALKLTPPFGSSAARQSTANLNSVLQQLRREGGDVARLLLYATQPHGIQPAPAIALSETKLIQELESWIAVVRNPVVQAGFSQPLAAQPAPFRFQPFAPAIELSPVAPGSTELRLVPRGLQSPSPLETAATRPVASEMTTPATAFPNGVLPPTLSEIDALDAALKLQLGETAPASATAGSDDPFDPAEFNRQRR